LAVIGFYGDHARTRQRTIKGNRNRGGDITGTSSKLALVKELMDIGWMAWNEATQAIPPAYTEFIGKQLLEALA
jgi:DNA (cytosine-5)-methyltransferase 1